MEHVDDNRCADLRGTEFVENGLDFYPGVLTIPRLSGWNVVELLSICGRTCAEGELQSYASIPC
jgi:hypothetical protein